MPAFDEQVTEWFRDFAKKALVFEWPRERWVGLVTNVLKDTTLEAYARVGVDDLDDYNEFKTAMLKEHELRPEAYRLQFRGTKKRPSDTNIAYMLGTWRRRLRSGC